MVLIMYLWPWHVQSKGVGVVNASPLSMGLLSPKGPQPWHPAAPRVKEKCKKAVDVCNQRGVSLPKLALMEAVQ